MRLDAPIQPESPEQTDHIEETFSFSKSSSPSNHFIETVPSILRHIPWIQCVEHKVRINEYELIVHDTYKIVLPVVCMIILDQCCMYPSNNSCLKVDG